MLERERSRRDRRPTYVAMLDRKVRSMRSIDRKSPVATRPMTVGAIRSIAV
jgi:hypothetical protein